MPEFAVDPASLRSAALAVLRVATMMSTAAQQRAKIDAERAGFGWLADDVNRFDEHWWSKAQALATTLDSVETFLGDAARAYDSVDTSIGAAASSNGASP